MTDLSGFGLCLGQDPLQHADLQYLVHRGPFLTGELLGGKSKQTPVLDAQRNSIGLVGRGNLHHLLSGGNLHQLLSGRNLHHLLSGGGA